MSKSRKKLLRYVGRGTAATTGEAETRAPAPAAGLPATGYDALPVEAVLAHLGELTPAGLAKLADHERAHQNRPAVLSGIGALLNHEPWPGYDALDVDGVRSGLTEVGHEHFANVLAYERAHRNRAGVLLATQQHPAEGST